MRRHGDPLVEHPVEALLGPAVGRLEGAQVDGRALGPVVESCIQADEEARLAALGDGAA